MSATADGPVETARGVMSAFTYNHTLDRGSHGLPPPLSPTDLLQGADQDLGTLLRHHNVVTGAGRRHLHEVVIGIAMSSKQTKSRVQAASEQPL